MGNWKQRHRPAEVAPIIAARGLSDQVEPRRNQWSVDQGGECTRIDKGRTRHHVAGVERNDSVAGVGNDCARPSSNVRPDDSWRAATCAFGPEDRPPLAARMQVGTAAQLTSIVSEPLGREWWQRLEHPPTGVVRPDDVL